MRPALARSSSRLQLLGRKIDPVEIARDPPVGRHDDHARGVGVELGLRVERVAKPDRLGQAP